ncbi:hypothetical protein V6478_001175 [Providencia rettgeri]|uniref:hypothetical protein n=1 Tax=Providencia sp. PROV024 TaxID=2949758 RepID=UPI00234A9B27|nr:hypothetical protein [Providencia sp. PROV024]ELR5029730.1 hypothetical protein [Providencia rettgeri]ELR5249037.1 hypothetical protein [Providencia rettgeri]WOC05447.1 hypothetical protein P3L56_06640 [Providencia sp. PROV024]
MARARNIKPGFFTNDDLAECEPLARILFVGLWTVADREGRLEDKPRKIKAMVLPYDDADCDKLLAQLHGKNFITRYAVDGNEFIQINNWKKHQNPHMKEAASEIPEQVTQPTDIKEAPEKHYTSTVQEQEENQTIPADSLNLIPDSLNLIPYNTQAEKTACPGDEKKSSDNVQPIAKKYAFEGQVIRLNQKDFDTWKGLFPNIDLVAELTRLDLEFEKDKPKNWFSTASAKLNYQNKNAKPTWTPNKRVASENFGSKDYGQTDMPTWVN